MSAEKAVFVQLVASNRRKKTERVALERDYVVLTLREDEVLRLMALGKANKEIAAVLGNTERTVKFHIGNLLRKFGVTTWVDRCRPPFNEGAVMEPALSQRC